jgi:alginate O-acetyltransferase complex protein AlgI
MLFNSISFLIFFPIVTAIYFALPHRWRWAHLLLASCAFYMAFVPIYILILLGTIAVDYLAGLMIENAKGFARRMFLAASIVANVGVLAFFKYFNFLDATTVQICHALGLKYAGSPLAILLPIGLSFHTFQAMSYTIEVYRGRQKAERHLGIYALYVMFYPQLVAGPIERPQNLLHQFREEHHFDFDRICGGLSRMLWGMFKKVVIADRLAILVDSAYDAPATCPRGWLIAATYLFALQIYCDFSAYTDIALGAAQVMGFRLMENFDRPYAAASVGEFWRRWHISLSTWFKDYLYFPLGGNRVSPARWVFNIMVVFVLSGLWHGASWAFVIWGGLHGTYLIVERWTAGLRDRVAESIGLNRLPRLRRSIGVLVTFNVVCFAWIFFRAGTTASAVAVVKRIFLPTGPLKIQPFNTHAIPLMIVLIVILEIVQLAQRGRSIASLFAKTPLWLRWPVYYALVVTILWIGVLGQRSFIYFQF